MAGFFALSLYLSDLHTACADVGDDVSPKTVGLQSPDLGLPITDSD
jgi:hypothetical protein